MNKKEDHSDFEADLEEEVTQVLREDEAKGERQEKGVEAPQDQKLKEMEDKYLRTYADFENYRKRMVKEKEELVFLINERLLREVLEVKDHLEMALSHSENATEVKGLREGVQLTLKQLGKVLEKYGVTEVQTLGETFDPALHEAIQQEVNPDCKPGSIVHVFQKGYLYQGRLLRAARVTVATS